MRRLTIVLALLAAVAGVALAVGASVALYHIVVTRSAQEPVLDAEAQAAAEKAKAEWLRQIDSPFVVRLVITSVEKYGTGNYIFVFDVYRWFGVGRGYAAVARAADGEPVAAGGGTLSRQEASWDDVELARLRRQWAEQYAEAPCTDEEAMAIIRAFLGRPDLALTAHGATSEARPWERDFMAGPGGIFTVDVERRAVVIAIMPPGLAGPGGTLDCDQARQAAREFAAARVPGFDRLTLLSDTLADHGAAGGQHCEFRWGELLGAQRARGIQFVAVSVDGASGSIVDFHQILPVPITVSVEPKVSRGRALAIAGERFGARITESTAELSVWWRHNDPNQGQVLRWQVRLQSDEPISEGSPILKKAAYTIDAATGEVLEETR